MSLVYRLACALLLGHIATTGCSWFEVDEDDPIDAAPAGESGRIDVPALAAGDEFGTAVAAAPDFLAVGAPGDDRQGSAAGAVHFFVPTAEGWGEAGVLTAADPRSGDRFGAALALTGDLLAVGAPGRDQGGSAAGSVYLYRRDGSAWQPVAALFAPDGAAGSRFGTSVAFVDPGRLAIGASGHDGNAVSAGAAYLFAAEADEWVPVLQPMAIGRRRGPQRPGLR